MTTTQLPIRTVVAGLDVDLDVVEWGCVRCASVLSTPRARKAYYCPLILFDRIYHIIGTWEAPCVD